MKWTRERPSSEGFYWFKGTIGEHDIKVPVIVQLHDNGVTLYAKIFEKNFWPNVTSANGKWAGPLEPPQE